jgi:hypothetical protein
MPKTIMNELVQAASVTVTQGGADAFVNSAIQTGISTLGNFGWLLHRVDYTIRTAAAGIQGVSADAEIQVQLCRKTQTAIIDFEDQDLLMDQQFALSLTTSGQVWIPESHVWYPPDNMVVVDPEISVSVDSDATGLTLVVDTRVYYFPVSMSQMDILRLTVGFQ